MFNYGLVHLYDAVNVIGLPGKVCLDLNTILMVEEEKELMIIL